MFVKSLFDPFHFVECFRGGFAQAIFGFFMQFQELL